jgi:hypothetical protein
MSRKVTGSADVEAEEGVEFTNPASDDIIDVDDHVKLEETSDGLFEPDCVESQAETKKRAQQLDDATEQLVTRIMAVVGTLCFLVFGGMAFSMFYTLHTSESIFDNSVATVDYKGDLDLGERACSAEPCQNKGFCVPTFPGYKCVCECATGDRCEIVQSDCVPDRLQGASTEQSESSRLSNIARLKQHLLAEYDPTVRPIASAADATIDVNVGMAVLQVTEVNAATGSVTLNIWLRVSWHDKYLTWDPADWGGITELDFDPNPELDFPELCANFIPPKTQL